jgi:hypothetical protein
MIITSSSKKMFEYFTLIRVISELIKIIKKIDLNLCWLFYMNGRPKDVSLQHLQSRFCQV